MMFTINDQVEILLNFAFLSLLQFHLIQLIFARISFPSQMLLPNITIMETGI